jgi:hypothetical protein
VFASLTTALGTRNLWGRHFSMSICHFLWEDWGVKDQATQLLGYETVPIFARKMVFYYGLAAINWAKLEQQLDLLLLTMNLPEFDNEKHRETPNTSFKMKCDLFKKWFVEDPRFRQFHDKARRLHKSLCTASNDRKQLFHSSVLDFLRGEPIAVKIQNLRHDNTKRKIYITTGDLNQDQVEKIAVGLARLTGGMRELCQGVMTDEFRVTLRNKTS